MIINDLYLIGSAISPYKTYPILIIDTDTVLIFQSPRKQFKSVTWRYPQVQKFFRRIYLVKFPGGDRPQIARTCASRQSRVPSVENVLSGSVCKRPYHGITVSRISCYKKVLGGLLRLKLWFRKKVVSPSSQMPAIHQDD